MTLPDWDFGGDEKKRRAFVAWVNAELDRFAALTGTYEPQEEPDNWAQFLPDARREAKRPPNPAIGMNELIWEYALLRFMFNRYWPGKRRRIDDPAHAANIVIERSRGPLPSDHRRKGAEQNRAELRASLLQEWKRSDPSKGREQAERDIEILRALPSSLFEK